MEEFNYKENKIFRLAKNIRVIWFDYEKVLFKSYSHDNELKLYNVFSCIDKYNKRDLIDACAHINYQANKCRKLGIVNPELKKDLWELEIGFRHITNCMINHLIEFYNVKEVRYNKLLELEFIMPYTGRENRETRLGF